MYVLAIPKSVVLYALDHSELDVLPALHTLATTGKVTLTPSVRISRCVNRYYLVDQDTENGDMLVEFLPPTQAHTLPCCRPSYTRMDGHGQPHDADTAMNRAWDALVRRFPRHRPQPTFEQFMTGGEAGDEAEKVPHGFGLLAAM